MSPGSSPHNDDLLIGRVYPGRCPDGRRLFTFPMVRSYGLDNMTVADHKAICDKAAVPKPGDARGGDALSHLLLCRRWTPKGWISSKKN